MMRGICPLGLPIGHSHSTATVLLRWGIVVVATATLVSAAVLVLAHGSASAVLRPPVPDMVELHAGIFHYRAAGEFSRHGKPATAPIISVAIKRPLVMMKHQVTAADYQRCVAAEACPAIDDGSGAAANVPMVKVNWRDAHAYASWLSRETGQRFRLPTDEEWAYAAASRFRDDALPETRDMGDPGQRALAIYERDASRQERFDQAPRPIGSFGANENGLLDVAGNVWEWTDTCYARNAFDARSEEATTINCGVRVVEGRHRTYMADFIRDARVGGCSTGVPPSNLGFRLVRDDDPRQMRRILVAWVRRVVGLPT